MTRKLMVLSAVATIALVANGLNAQEGQQSCQQCPAMKTSHAIELATLAGNIKVEDGMMLINGHMVPLTKVSGATKCPANCNQCETTKTDCETCPHCCAQKANASNNTGVPTRLAAELTGSSGLPGSTAFIREQCEELSATRKQLAKQITEYLASGDHSPEHMQRVLELAMESAADQAHRQAVRPVPFMTNLGNMSHYAANDLGLNLQSEAPPAPEANNTANQREQDLMMKLKKMTAEQQSTRDIVTLLQKDLQRIAEDVSLLRVESNMMTRAQKTNSNSRSQTWPSRVEASQPSGMVRIRNQYTNAMTPQPADSVTNLKRQIQQLEQQLAMMTQRQTNGVRQATLETPMRPLTPRYQAGMPLTPVAPLRTNTVTYYVGDIMAPPFVSATLQLMQFMKANVDPDSWNRHGKIEISEPSISLSITQTPENHTQIQNILESIRAGRVSYKRNTRQSTTTR